MVPTFCTLLANIRLGLKYSKLKLAYNVAFNRMLRYS
jgi:hypothetical protein